MTTAAGESIERGGTRDIDRIQGGERRSNMVHSKRKSIVELVLLRERFGCLLQLRSKSDPHHNDGDNGGDDSRTNSGQ